MPSKLSATSQRERTGGPIVGLGDIHRCVLDFESCKFCFVKRHQSFSQLPKERTGGSIVGLGDIHRCVLDFESCKFCVLFSAVQMRKRITFFIGLASKILFEGHRDIHENFLNVVWTYTRTNPLVFLYASLNKAVVLIIIKK